MEIRSPSGSWRLIFGYVFAFSALGFTAYYIGLNWKGFVNSLSTIGLMHCLIVLMLLALHVWLNARGFASLSRAFGVQLPATILSAAWMGSLLSKYAPGGVWHVVGRGALLSAHGVPARLTVYCGISEQGVSLLMCAVPAVIALAIARYADILIIIIAVGSCAVVIIVAAVLFSALIARPNCRYNSFAAFGLYGIAMVPYGMAYILISRAPDVPEFIFALFVGTIAGVVAILAPGGLGVRESVSVVLADQTSTGELLVPLLAVRALILIVEICFSYIGMTRLLRTG